MYLSELKLWNFRKFGSNGTFDRSKPNLVVPFQKGLNLLVGENDSGKTAIIDAIRLILGTNNFYERNPLDIDDFHKYKDDEGIDQTAEILRIECLFYFQDEYDSKNFLEWAHFDKDAKYVLRLFLEATLNENISGLKPDIKGGIDDDGTPLNKEAIKLLQVTYLKPLRDAETELQPKKNSRLSQILASHKFAEEKNGKNTHPLVSIVKQANDVVNDFFIDGGIQPHEPEKYLAITLRNQLNKSLSNFFGLTEIELANFDVSEATLRSVLEKLMLSFDEVNKGLGSQNLLFIAAELLLLERDIDFTGLRLALIEEIEAHLHPQAQMRLVEYLQKECSNKDVQMLLTTHSPNLASKVKLENLIICQDEYAYPMGSDYTMLEKGDYAFLERFLDVTKANLFFAKGVILVEGDAENLLLPTIAKIINCDLTQNGVSIVNLGGLTFKYYERIFIQKNKPQGEQMNIPVAVVTDVDTKVWEYYQDVKNSQNLQNCYELSRINIDDVNTKYSGDFDNLLFDPQNSLFDNFEEGVLIFFRKFLKKGKNRLPNGFKTFIESQVIKREITERELSSNQTQVKKLKEQQHSSAENIKIKGFVNTHWTLEYELALSCLRKQFYTAVLMADESSFFDFNIYEFKKKIAFAKINHWKKYKKNGHKWSQIAYQIYWVEMMGNGKSKTSKATVAHFFAEILEMEMRDIAKKSSLQAQIEADPHLEYLVKAIKHTSSKP